KAYEDDVYLHSFPTRRSSDLTYIKWYVPNFKRRTAYLYGKIIKSGKDTLINLKIKPNPVVAIFPILTVLIGLIFIIIAELNNERSEEHTSELQSRENLVCRLL